MSTVFLYLLINMTASQKISGLDSVVVLLGKEMDGTIPNRMFCWVLFGSFVSNVTVMYVHIWVFPKIGVPQNGFDDLGYPYFRTHPYVLDHLYHVDLVEPRHQSFLHFRQIPGYFKIRQSERTVLVLRNLSQPTNYFKKHGLRLFLFKSLFILMSITADLPFIQHRLASPPKSESTSLRHKTGRAIFE